MSRTIYTTLNLLAVLALVGMLGPASAAPRAAAYVDPTLQTTAAQVDVIVSATSAERAAAAVLAVGGSVSSELWLIDAVAARVPASAISALSRSADVTAVVANRGVTSSDWGAGWVTDLPLRDTYDGRPDAQPTADPAVWDVVTLVPVDVGADVLHNQGITGDGVTVAVVDSGVYFDSNVRATLGSVVSEQFLGQADFVDSQCAVETLARNRTRRIGTQRSDFCWLNHQDTADGYGHGTSVASIIWNNFTDATTGVRLGVAPDASILSVRVLNDEGVGSYETVIKGIQYVVQNRNRYDVRVMNLSISAPAEVPYFVDPLNRAVEQAWLRGITVVTAAGNDGPAAGSVTVPGNDPYVITVGAVNSNRTPGYWADDTLPEWSASGPTGDGFVKPDLVAPGVNILTFMYKDPSSLARSQYIVQIHPDNAVATSLFRMNGTSMATAVASGVAALVIDANEDLTPDQVKYRLMATARPATVGEAEPQLAYPVFQQGMGRIWAADAALEQFAPTLAANPGMNLRADLNAGYEKARDLAKHYQGPVQQVVSDDGTTVLYYIPLADGQLLGLGVADADGSGWLSYEVAASKRLAWSVKRLAWSVADLQWAGSVDWDASSAEAGKRLAWSVKRLVWSVGDLAWNSSGELVVSGQVDASKRLVWSVKRLVWSVGSLDWAGGLSFSEAAVDASKRLVWSVSTNIEVPTVEATSWVNEP